MRKMTILEEFRREMRSELGKAVADAVLKTGKHLPAVLSREEVWGLYGAAKSFRDLCILRAFYASQVRNAELVHLKVADLFPDTGELFVRGGKEDEDRYVFVDPTTMRMLLQWRDSQHLKPGDSLFGITTTRQMLRIVVGCGVRTGIVAKYSGMNRSFSPQALRHAGATHAYENGMDLFSIKKLLGHHFLETTQIYVHLAMAQEGAVYHRTHEMCRRDAPQTVTWVEPKKRPKA